MGLYQYIRNVWKQPKQNLGDVWKQRLVLWRRQPTTVRVEKPTRLDRARSLGYKAKQGYIVVRQRVVRGGHTNPNHRSGRRPKRFGKRKDLSISYQVICEQRASSKHPNCEVLNSYYVAKDGKYIWYEVILLDRAHPVIKKDKRVTGVIAQKGRVKRGLTSAAKKSRGLRNKGKGAEKVRPSRRAHNRKSH